MGATATASHVQVNARRGPPSGPTSPLSPQRTPNGDSIAGACCAATRCQAPGGHV